MTSYTIEDAAIAGPDEACVRTFSVCDGRIVLYPNPHDDHISLRDHVIFPGLINAHEHLHRNAVPSMRHSEYFPNSYRWIDAMQSHLKDPAVRAVQERSSLVRHWHGGIKNALSGVTTVAHHDPRLPFLGDSSFPVRVVDVYGWAHSLALGGLTPAESEFRYGPDLVASYHATPQDEPWIVHLAEGTDAVANREMHALADAGCVRSNSVLVHCVGLTSDDMVKVEKQQASIVWCPSSNMRMLGKTLDPAGMRDLLRLALGTDSRLTGSRDLLREMRVAQHASGLRAREIVALATSNAARVLRLEDVGALIDGSRADFIVLRGAHTDSHERLVRARRSDLRAVIRDGAPVVTDPDLEHWFRMCDVAFRTITLDGREKRIADSLLTCLEAAKMEPGLEILEDAE